MHESDKSQFANVLKATADSYGRRPYLPETMAMWFELFKAFSIEEFRMACLRHAVADPRNPPNPASLMAILNPKSILGPEEAWGKAVEACDESRTVVMNDHIAEAWGICKPIMDIGDEVGARMAFKEAYQRITASAQEPAKWYPSIGTDPHHRDAALSEARKQGLLPATQVAALLPPPLPKKGEKNPPGLQRLKEVMAELKLKNAGSADAEQKYREGKRQAEADRKAKIDEAVKRYKGDDDEK